MSLLTYLLKSAAPLPPASAPAPPVDIPGGMPTSIRPGLTLRDHQTKAVRRLVENDGKLIMAHGMGSGKTVSSIVGSEVLRATTGAKRVLVVTPSGLRKNYADAVTQFTTSRAYISKGPNDIDPAAVYNVISYDALRRDPVGVMQRSGADTLIVDEFHTLRNEQSETYGAAMQARRLAKNFIGLTASPINNHPEELASLLSLSENNPRLTRNDFKRKFVETVGQSPTFTGSERPLFGLKNPAGFAKAVFPKVDYMSTEDIPGNSMPRKDTKYVDVPMSSDQWRLYQLALDRLGPVSNYITRRDKNVTVGQAEQIFTQIGQARQLSNSVAMGRSDVTPEQSAERTPKLKRVLDDTAVHMKEHPDAQVVLYTNLIHGGVDSLTAGLRARGIDHALFIGKGTEVGPNKVTETSRQQGVDDFKAGKKKVIVISGAGAEGLDLKNATAFYSLDGHFNPERILQAEARARRLGGQAARAPADRVVDVRRYRSTAPWGDQPSAIGRFFGRKPERTVDAWVYDTAARKFETNSQFTTALRHANKYIRKETVTGTDGAPRVRYIYPSEATPAPGLLGRLMGAPPPPKLEAA